MVGIKFGVGRELKLLHLLPQTFFYLCHHLQYEQSNPFHSPQSFVFAEYYQ